MQKAMAPTSIQQERVTKVTLSYLIRQHIMALADGHPAKGSPDASNLLAPKKKANFSGAKKAHTLAQKNQ
ncbi:hypothetical protein [Pseudomonas sp. LFM046]|uniref:hypothetical protein n=1 Tax=Pseudomonas sp. LFM046 TaxID=1608357 RepID=UPI0011AEC442|nr:hypothetical protein [Pseudomonas sp. LFM046]